MSQSNIQYENLKKIIFTERFSSIYKSRKFNPFSQIIIITNYHSFKIGLQIQCDLNQNGNRNFIFWKLGKLINII